ncbi:hypothetical protein D9M71_732340 [compost metagenome]
MKKATAELFARAENLRRITIKALGDETGESALLEKQISKLPKTRAFIVTVIESEQQYRKRRVQKVIEQMKTNAEPIREWQVIKQAGIKEKFCREILKEIHEI